MQTRPTQALELIDSPRNTIPSPTPMGTRRYAWAVVATEPMLATSLK